MVIGFKTYQVGKPTIDAKYKLYVCQNATSKELGIVSAASSMLPKMMAMNLKDENSLLVCVNLIPTDEQVQQIFCGSEATTLSKIGCQVLEGNRTLCFDEEETNESLLKDAERPCRFRDNLPKGYRLLNSIKVNGKARQIVMLKNQESYDPRVNQDTMRAVSDSQIFTLQLKSGSVVTRWNHIKDGRMNSANISRQSICNTAWPRSTVYLKKEVNLKKSGSNKSSKKNRENEDDNVYGVAHVAVEYMAGDNRFINCEFITLLPQGSLWLMYALLCLLPEEKVADLGLGLNPTNVSVLNICF